MEAVMEALAVLGTWVLLYKNFRAVQASRHELRALTEKARVDNAMLIRHTWREAQAVLLAEMEGSVTSIADYEHKKREVNVLNGYRIPEYLASGGTAGSEPQDSPELDS